MQSNLLTVVAEMIAKPGKEAALRERLLALVEPSRNDEGCVQYDLHVSTDEPGRFVFYENWTGKEALDKHARTPHLTAFGEASADLLAEPPRILAYTRIA